MHEYEMVSAQTLILNNHEDLYQCIIQFILINGVGYTVEPVYIEHSREMKKCSMYAGVQCIQVLSKWRSVEIEIKSRVIRET